MLIWARKRKSISKKSVYKKFPKLDDWETGKTCPTLKQLEKFAQTVHTPIGYFFFNKPPQEKTPIPDFRKMAGTQTEKLSLNLLDTIFICQKRQDWYKDYLLSIKEKPLSFIGSVQPVLNNVSATAEKIRKIIKFNIEERQRYRSWTEALDSMVKQVNLIGVLVMVSGIVENNNQRKLNPKEFRGFALCDSLAPLIFINGADTKAAQMFTIAHELAHLWINQSGVSNAQPNRMSDHRIESWCNKVAAELLVPTYVFKKLYKIKKIKSDFYKEVQRMAKYFKVSSLVILYRIYNINQLSSGEFKKEYEKELKKLKEKEMENRRNQTGGSFYPSLSKRVNPYFSKALITNTLEGRTLFKEAFNLLGIKRMSTFKGIGEHLGVRF